MGFQEHAGRPIDRTKAISRPHRVALPDLRRHDRVRDNATPKLKTIAKLRPAAHGDFQRNIAQRTGTFVMRLLVSRHQQRQHDGTALPRPSCRC
jgi:hypothetical protein